ncbi:MULTISPECIES: iron chelate uptake ABC transporter family permease subunit [unclassified Gilliamella]|uniref:iron chelate uptake ABC transporter family permease subunit n=1 Tax=unclassified Gilliamella TaxID=2685620 RepID=UPI000810BD8E|nr:MULTISPECIES: iron chelate uptake ABC transporter family permease subunit [Gilliamella]MCX8583873.1 iron chelate uptake ABC transporter family permease subunit [Gilliamella sp. B3372]MCX8585392.1 iron chelate uptake ABC transporter family permease subunit [Gilliamella sp. B3562]MCX8594540.1 iron chelate uptake ABC transporter family permease subunit [Gilliamella sp. B3367]MCX8670658.1 iron chelate uptake ABC transporter family permease subunit [Gilliamella sp. B2785]MCX8675479.1 iron chelat
MLVNQKRHISSRKTVWLLLGIAVLCVVFFMTFNLKGNISYILTHRTWIVLTMILVAFSAATSTLLFQTVTNNRILTPSIMGFESLFVLIQTVVIFFIDAQGIPYIGIVGKFIFESLLLILFSLFLYRGLFNKLKQNLHLVLLIGIILGTLFRSFSNLLQRLMTPTEFAVLQSRIFATFTRAEPVLIVFSLVISSIIGLFLWRMRFRFDVLALGRDNAINLGIDYQKSVTIILLLVSVLVSISTALVGPFTFLGLLIANLAYSISGSSQHRFLLPTAFLLGIIFLVGGQMFLEHVLNMVGALSIVIEFIGGSLFIFLLLKKVPM